MKYRLLKPLDICVAGDIFELMDTGDNCLPKRTWLDCRSKLFSLPAELAQDPNWFEEVKPWVPAIGEKYYFVCDQMCWAWSVRGETMPTSTDEHIKHGNCFRTEQEARDCAAQMRVLLAAWKEAHE